MSLVTTDTKRAATLIRPNVFLALGRHKHFVLLDSHDHNKDNAKSSRLFRYECHEELVISSALPDCVWFGHGYTFLDLIYRHNHPCVGCRVIYYYLIMLKILIILVLF
jgi:hypothetical protein